MIWSILYGGKRTEHDLYKGIVLIPYQNSFVENLERKICYDKYSIQQFPLGSKMILYMKMAGVRTT